MGSGYVLWSNVIRKSVIMSSKTKKIDSLTEYDLLPYTL